MKKGRTVRIKVFKFDELSDEAKQKAIQWYRQGEQQDCFWLDEFVTTIKAACKAFDAPLADWSIDPTDRHRCTWKNDYGTHHYYYLVRDTMTGIRLRTYLINNYYDLLFEGKPYGKYQQDKNGKWFYPHRSKVIFKETDCPFTGFGGDEDFLKTFREFIKKPDNSNFEELINSAIYDVCTSLEDETAYRFSDKTIAEDIICNEYEFTQDGKIFPG